MQRPFVPPFASLLLVALLFPGWSTAWSVSHSGTAAPSDPREQRLGQGANRSHSLHHRVKRFLPPRTPPYFEPEPDFKVINCKKNEGFCQEYCNFMETQVGYCSKKKDACCLPRS